MDEYFDAYATFQRLFKDVFYTQYARGTTQC